MKTLLLDKMYRPISFVGFQKMVRLVMTGKAEVIAEWEGVNIYKGMDYPATILLKTYIRKRPLLPRFNFRGVFRRDMYRCFPESVRVLMASGREKYISEIKEGDSVIDAYGDIRTVIAIGNKEVDKLLSVKFRGSFERLLVTPDHPFLSPDLTFKEISDPCLKYGLFPKNVLYQRESKTLCSYDYLPKDKIYKLLNGEIKPVNRSKNPGIPLFIKHSSDLAYLLGLYVAEGSFSSHVAFSFGIHEKDTLAEDVVRCVWNVFGIRATKRLNENRHTCVVTVLSAPIGEFFKSLCGHKSYGKTTPWDGIGPFVTDYLRGLFLGDSYIKRIRYKIQLDMSSQNVIYGARSLLWSLGIYPNLYNIHRQNRKPAWQLILQGENYVRFSNIVLGEQCDSRKEMFGNETHFFSLIKEKTEILEKTTVYNLEVSGSNTYIVNGIAVHNCQYTGVILPPSQLTVDHIIPKARGGKSVWDNCVTASLAVNAAKGNRTPEEAGLKLLRKPIAPSDSLALEYAVIPNPHPDWEMYFPGVRHEDVGTKEELDKIAS